MRYLAGLIFGAIFGALACLAFGVGWYVGMLVVEKLILPGVTGALVWGYTGAGVAMLLGAAAGGHSAVSMAQIHKEARFIRGIAAALGLLSGGITLGVCSLAGPAVVVLGGTAAGLWVAWEAGPDYGDIRTWVEGFRGVLLCAAIVGGALGGWTRGLAEESLMLRDAVRRRLTGPPESGEGG